MHQVTLRHSDINAEMPFVLWHAERKMPDGDDRISTTPPAPIKLLYSYGTVHETWLSSSAGTMFPGLMVSEILISELC